MPCFYKKALFFAFVLGKGRSVHGFRGEREFVCS